MLTIYIITLIGFIVVSLYPIYTTFFDSVEKGVRCDFVNNNDNYNIHRENDLSIVIAYDMRSRATFHNEAWFNAIHYIRARPSISVRDLPATTREVYSIYNATMSRDGAVLFGLVMMKGREMCHLGAGNVTCRRIGYGYERMRVHGVMAMCVFSRLPPEKVYVTQIQKKCVWKYVHALHRRMYVCVCDAGDKYCRPSRCMDMYSVCETYDMGKWTIVNVP